MVKFWIREKVIFNDIVKILLYIGRLFFYGVRF